MIKYIPFAFYNLLYSFLSISFLFYANTFLNSFLIPNSWVWKDGKMRENSWWLIIPQSGILLIEGFILLYIIYFVNKWYLTTVIKQTGVSNIMFWAAGIISLLVVATALFVVYLSLK